MVAFLGCLVSRFRTKEDHTWDALLKSSSLFAACASLMRVITTHMACSILLSETERSEAWAAIYRCRAGHAASGCGIGSGRIRDASQDADSV